MRKCVKIDSVYDTRLKNFGMTWSYATDIDKTDKLERVLKKYGIPYIRTCADSPINPNTIYTKQLSRSTLKIIFKLCKEQR